MGRRRKARKKSGRPGNRSRATPSKKAQRPSKTAGRLASLQLTDVLLWFGGLLGATFVVLGLVLIFVRQRPEAGTSQETERPQAVAAVYSPRVEKPTAILDEPKAASLAEMSWRYGRTPWAEATVSEAPRYWWTSPPDAERAGCLAIDGISNVRLDDYAGAESCKECHPKNYNSWAKHPHRWMNAQATDETVMGDFSGEDSASIEYFGGRATFYREQDEFRFRLKRGPLQRVYAVNRTIGSRFQQYYVGKLIEGPEPAAHAVRRVDHVLPFGYWLDRKEWVPVVHVDAEGHDDIRADPFADPPRVAYDRECAMCHTTQPAGDRMLRVVGRERLAAYGPHPVSFAVQDYLQEMHPKLLERSATSDGGVKHRIRNTIEAMDDLPSEEHAAALGIACEACHNGAQYHVDDETRMPRFFPSSDHVLIKGASRQTVWGRTPENINWTCSQCHSGGRPMFAAGVSVWNSTELSDAMRGHCYDVEKAQQQSMKHLTCVHCHNPHVATGKKWSHSPESDDRKCIDCHQQYDSPEQRLAHTHHAEGSSGARCMNCHMPKMNEGMQDIVRTHLIFNPTHGGMLEANQPNACNLCHLKEPIDWTLKHLREWYDLKEQGEVRGTNLVNESKVYAEQKLAASYPFREGPVGVGWLKSPHESTRLVAVEAMTKARATWALPQLIEMLDDPYLLNRQFAMQGLERMLGTSLDQFGYHFYMFADERRAPLAKIRAALLDPQRNKLSQAQPRDK